MAHVRQRTRCQSCITAEGWRLGKFSNAGRIRADRWTPEEDDLLRAMAGSLTAAQIASKLGCRTRLAVYMRAHYLGVYIQTEDWSLRRLRQLFGTWEPTIEHAWIGAGLLKARKLEPGDHCRQGEWRIREADVEAFILDCPWAYDATLMVPQSHRLAQFAARVQRRDPWVTIDEAMVYLGMSRSAVTRWCHNGVIAFKRCNVGHRGGVHGTMVIRAADLPAAKEAILVRQRSYWQATIAAIADRRRAAHIDQTRSAA
jgi:hypothetical protein